MMIAVGAILLAVAGLLALSLFGTMRDAREELERGRSEMERGRGELLAGDAEAAAASFRAGRSSFARVERRLDGIAVRAVGWVPFLGRTKDAIDAIADASVTTADAAIVLADAAAEIPGGLSGLMPADGRVRLEHLPPLARAAESADGLMRRAVARLEQAPTSLLLGPVGPARTEAEAELTDLSGTVHATSLILDGLPRFLGADEPRRYFFGAQTPAELRGTGGVIGAYSVLEIDDGRFSFAPFLPIHGLPTVKDLPAPNEDYADSYEQFRRGGRFWTAINVMPDFPSVARAILTSYEAATGEQLDGVVLADPFAEAALLAAAGPVELPGYDIQLDAQNVVPFSTNEAYGLFDDAATRKRVLGDVARAAFERFVNQPSVDEGDLARLFDAVATRHILAFSEDPAMQEGLRATPVGGALRPRGADDDLVSVVVNSGAGSKVDYYQERSVRYAVDLKEDGSSTSDLELTLENHAPTSGQPRYVIGPFGTPGSGPILKNLEPGQSVALVNVYCGTDCVPVDARLDGSGVGARTEVDLGVRFIRHYYPIRSGDEKTLQLSWADPSAWEGNSSGGVYRMTFTNQVTIRPSTLELRIEPPDGMRIVSASSPLRVVDGAAVYEGEPGTRIDVEVEFEPSLPVRLWRNVERFLQTPVFES
jgi:hypothetical protein